MAIVTPPSATRRWRHNPTCWLLPTCCRLAVAHRNSLAGLAAVALSILEDSQVSVEFRARNHKVTRVLRVSSDGTRVFFYKPPLGWHLSTEGVAPAPPQGAPVHSWDALPQALWAKYACAARFVSLVRQKTPKIILYAEYALCIRLGSGDLEASFYSGARVVCSGNHVQLMDVGGPQRHLTLPVDPEMLPPSQCSLWQITCEYHRRCQALEAALEATDEGWNIFPAIFGSASLVVAVLISVAALFQATAGLATAVQRQVPRVLLFF
ncbi:serine/threonine-protein kinase PLK4-like [Ixodes scapularis]|uniref:serine/threonine-protein kinase PLK4-like n=1 Tax=Ixodes scapularis TaxID=6945 RepID=UPI001C3866C1|nr:serine/threonine-protein kinase PLK4-like [Ixodes scapularis]